MKNSLSILFALLFSIVYNYASYAQNLTTSVQGVLRDAQGRSVEDGTYSIVFKLYTVDNGGTAVWTETQGSVGVTHGVFSVELGAVTSLPNINAATVYYLGISVEGGAELQPRIKLHKSFTANVTAAMAGTSNNVPSSGTAKLDAVQFPDNTSISTANPNKIGIPIGGIIMWSGSSASIPSNWKICDGANGTPDLRNRFIVAAGSTYGVGGTGGSNVHSLSTGQLPAHSHPGNISESGTHTHKYNDPRVGTYQGLLYDATGTAMEYPTEAGGTTTSTGSSHSHSFTTDNTGSGQSIDHTPLYYALYYIMKISN